MAGILTPETKGTVTTPEGRTSPVVATQLTEPEAMLLRAYRDFAERHHLNVVRVCQDCQHDVDIQVRGDFIGAACACRLRTYPGTSPTLQISHSTLGAPTFIVTPDGDPVPRLGTFTRSEAQLLFDYKAHVLRAFHWREKAFCEDCFRENRKEGCSFHVTDDKIGLRCRCREQSFGEGVH
jgi:hypothetical protein